MLLGQVAFVGKPVAPWRYRIAGSMMGGSYTLLIASTALGRMWLKNSRWESILVVEGTE